MEPNIRRFEKITLIGVRMRMSFANNKTKALWESFMPRRHEIKGIHTNEFYSVEVYDSIDFFETFNPGREFEKWAGLRAGDHDPIPFGMEKFNIPSGEYAVFRYVGKPSEAREFYRFIFQDWLPKSGFNLDQRPHFSIMDERYKGEDPKSEEDICIPLANLDKGKALL